MANSAGTSRTSVRARVGLLVAIVAIGALAAGVPYMNGDGPRDGPETMSIAPAVGMPGAPPTSAEGLRQRISDMEKQLAERPHDTGAAVLLADALWRQARVTGDGRPTARAAELLRSVLKESPGYYDALRMLGAVSLSQHRF